MLNCLKWFPMVLTVFGLLLLPGVTPARNDQNKPAFIDLDGDGFNDLAADGDDNGIPDEIEKSPAIRSEPMESKLGDVFNSKAMPDIDNDPFLSFADGFDRRSFRTRDLISHRGGFNSGESFGPGSGIGLGALVTGCVGPGSVVH
jgi:hypothetical protein